MRNAWQRSSSALVFLLAHLVLSPSALASAVPEDPVADQKQIGKQQGFFVEYFTYEDYVYSRSKKTELGDQVKLDSAFRYQFNPDTFGRIRFETDPVENRFDNKTSQFELLVGHGFENLSFQFDAEINTDSGTTGATAIGFDLDSELTFARWKTGPWELTFYPFNFNGEVGHEFNTWDVTRLYFIQGAPSTINSTQVGAEQIGYKTIPGVEAAITLSNTRIYGGVGAASYLYPANAAFDLETSPTADRWERREDIGFKFGASAKYTNHRHELQFVRHTAAAQTGSLLEHAASFYSINRFGAVTFEGEFTYTKAGSKPYRLTRSGTWFEQTAPFQPIYSDYNGTHQDWLGQSDFATSIRLGLDVGSSSIPYLAYKYQGANFIFRDRESAHRLRTADETASHGGLNRIGVGSYFNRGDFSINPEVEWLIAKNPVFGSSSDVRQDRILSSFEKQDFLLFLTVSYQYGGNTLFRP